MWFSKIRYVMKKKYFSPEEARTGTNLKFPVKKKKSTSWMFAPYHMIIPTLINGVSAIRVFVYEPLQETTQHTYWRIRIQNSTARCYLLNCNSFQLKGYTRWRANAKEAQTETRPPSGHSFYLYARMKVRMRTHAHAHAILAWNTPRIFFSFSSFSLAWSYLG